MSEKKILGLDIGTNSIGWALIKEINDKPTEILGMGVRIIPLDTDESDEFSRGNKISKNQQRTIKRSMRKRYYRYVLRRMALTEELRKHGMFDPNLFKLPQLKLWELRSKAVTEKIELTEVGRVLYHLNQKRGYKSSRIDNNNINEQTEYVLEINNRYQQLISENKTIGQKFYEELQKNQHYRTKQQIFPREAYIDEFEKIMHNQQKYYPDILNDELINHLRKIIYHQRKLKSQKGLVSICEFEGFYVKNQKGKEIFVGPKVAHRSNPIFQVEKIWESINNIVITNKQKQELLITNEQKRRIFEYLDNHEKLSQETLFEILGINKSQWYGNKMIKKGIQGNITKVAIKEALNNPDLEKYWLRFNLNINNSNEKVYHYHPSTGEVIGELEKKVIDESFINEPLYQLWHTIYSISDIEECKKVLINTFNFDKHTAQRLAQIDFSKYSYGNKSVKAIRKILPYLMDGYKYSEAASIAGYNHSNSLTKEQIESKKLLDSIPLLQKNSLRQPVVEKILNQMIHIVNDIIYVKRGWVTKEEREKGLFEIRVELARELKQSREERNETFKNLNRIERENREIEKKLQELEVRATRNNIIKYRLYSEITEKEKKLNAICVYTGKTISLSQVFNDIEVDVEHIIPKSLLFDDSQSNKTLTFRWINQEKGNRTAYDYMASKGTEELNAYIERVNKLYKDGIISKSKWEKLLTPADKIPNDFIQRQLRETQYIARKSKEVLSTICKNVWSTTGSVTDYLRRIWGWNDILSDLQLQRIKEIIDNPLKDGITEITKHESIDGSTHEKEIIKDWNKRDDHRHHAIDALIIACTKQGFIQRLNTLSAKGTRDELYKFVSERKEKFRESLSLVDKYFIAQRPFTTQKVKEKVAQIIISFKSGKKIATWGKRFIKKNGKRIVAQTHILVPRGPLSEESVYGRIKIIEKNKPVKYLFENPHLIFKPYIRNLVEQRLDEYKGDIKKALNSLKTSPIYLDENKKIKLEYATCFKEEYVIKYPVNSLKPNDVPFIVDKKVREIIENRLKQFNNNIKEAFKEPIYLDENKTIPIRSVRILTGLSAVEPIKYNEKGEPISFVKPGNNHHLAIYVDNEGKKIPHLCTFWHAVERKKYGIPVIITNPRSVWNIIYSNKESYPISFLEKLPKENWKLLQTFQPNEIFEIQTAVCPSKYYSNHLYRLQKMSIKGNGQIDLWFRQIFETQIKDDLNSRKALKFYNIQSINALEKINPQKININRLGEIIN